MTATAEQVERAEAHREKADECERRREESWQRSDTDGFLTQWANSMTAQLERRRADIAEDGDTAVFRGLYDGDRRVKAKLISYRCRYSHSDKWNWLLHDDEAERYGRKFVPEGPNSRVQKNLGLSERRERAPAYAFMNGRGRGLSGTAWVQTARKDPDAWGTDSVLEEDDDV